MRDIPGFLAIGPLHSADFDDKTITLRIEGDMPVLSRGRYALVSAQDFSKTVMLANAWREQQRAGKTA